MHQRAAAFLAAAVSLALPATAHGQDVARLPLGSKIQDFVAAPDGGAWLVYAPVKGRDRIGRLAPDGRFGTAVGGRLTGGVLGLDGHAWFRTGERGLVRVDGELRFTRAAFPRRFIGPFAIGPDATLWTPSYDGRMAHITAQGTVSYTRAPLPACLTPGAEQSELHEMVRAADGAMWITDFGCQRLLRVTSTATTEIGVHVTSFASLTPDAGGGAWFVPQGGDATHVDAAGRLRTVRLALGDVTGAAAGADGSVWFAHARCRLSRVDAAGRVTQLAVPLVTQELAVGGDGRLLLAGVTGLARLEPGTPSGPCDRRGPSVRVIPTRTITLAGLRRGVPIRVGERAVVVADALHQDAPGDSDPDYSPRESLHERTSGPRTLRYRVSAAQLRRHARRLAAGGRPQVRIGVTATDARGNATQRSRVLRITR